MIEIKKPGAAGTQLITTTLDLIAEGVDFTTLNTNRYKLLNGIGGKILVPVCLTLNYYSIGTQPNGFYIISEGLSFTGTNSLFNFFQYGVTTDQGGLIIVQNWGADVTASENILLAKGLELTTSTNIATAAYITFKISITYFYINSL